LFFKLQEVGLRLDDSSAQNTEQLSRWVGRKHANRCKKKRFDNATSEPYRSIQNFADEPSARWRFGTAAYRGAVAMPKALGAYRRLIG